MNCLFPVRIRLEEHNNASILVGCGKCYFCLQERRKAWYIRNLEEMRNPENVMSVFITLTYQDEDLPRQRGLDSEFSKKDVQLFLDRFRKRLLRQHQAHFRYFLVSEYGSQTERPHYHALFYLDKQIDILDFQMLLDSCWRYASITTDWHYLNEAEISYVCNYVLSYVFSEANNKQKPFMLSSRRPAIGASFLENHVKVNDSYRGDFIGYQDFQNRYKLPRYYKDKIFSDDEKFDIIETYLESLKESAFNERVKRIKMGDAAYFRERINDFWNRVREGEIKLSKSKHKL